MKLYEAYDIIDAYGADKSRWPKLDIAPVEALIAKDKALSDYYNEAVALDKALSSWEEGKDGVDVGENDGDKGGSKDKRDDAEDDQDDEQGDNDADGEDGGSGDDAGDGDGKGDSDDEGDEGFGDGGKDGEPGGGVGKSDLTTESDDPGKDLGMDLSNMRDIDTILNDQLAGMIHGAFNDHFQVCYTRDFDVIEPYDDSEGADPDVAAVEKRVHSTIAPMQKELQRLIVARSHATMAPGFRRGRLNPAALHRAPTGDDRLFRRKQQAVTNKVAISLVIDNSGSMCGRHPQSKVCTAMTAAWAFAETLDRLKIACDVVGFTNAPHPAGTDVMKVYDDAVEFAKATGIDPSVLRLNPFYMPIYKGFDEKFGPAQKRRMAHLMENQRILRSNNDALALEYAGKRLGTRSEPRKIMIVFSDGQPADIDDQYALNRTVVRNVANLEKSGIEVIGVGIASEAVKEFYAKHYVLGDVSALPQFVMRELKSLLVSPK